MTYIRESAFYVGTYMRKGLNRAFEIWPVTPGCRTLEPVTVLPQFRPQSQNTVSRGRVREPLGCTKKEIRLLVFVVVLVVVVIRRSSRVMREHDNIRLQTYLHAEVYPCAWHEDGSPKFIRACRLFIDHSWKTDNQTYGIFANIPFLW